MIGYDDSDPIRLCGVRNLCMLCYGNVVSQDFDGNTQRTTWQRPYWTLLTMAFHLLKPLIDGESTLIDAYTRVKRIDWLPGYSTRSPWAMLRPTARSALASWAC
ncbi:Uncharacterized protein HZ326_31128 [Fusarium oxysporum f. sp. albedinis]|nr:Uncharacterized protein HZ326_31128 [Fusarium oxysporum f. sp. albedinis]